MTETIPSGEQWPNPAFVEIGNGGSMPAPQRFQGAGPLATINDGAEGFLQFPVTFTGDSLVDLSDPQFPAVLASGVYAVSVTVAPNDDLTADGFYKLDLQLDVDGLDLIQETDSRLATVGQPRPVCGCSATFYMAAGGDGLIAVGVTNRDGAAARDFQLIHAAIQKTA